MIQNQSGSSGPGKGFLFFLLGNKDFKEPIMSLFLETKIKLLKKNIVVITKTVEVSASSSRFPITKLVMLCGKKQLKNAMH